MAKNVKLPNPKPKRAFANDKLAQRLGLETSDHSGWELFGRDNSIITVIVCLLLLISAVMVFSATLYSNPSSSLIKQVLSMVLGFIMIVAIKFVPNKWLDDPKLLNFLTLVTLAALFYATFFGREGGGASAWIDLKFFNLQPAELFKIVLILQIARFIKDSNREVYLKDEVPKWRRMAPLILSLFISIPLLVKQPDFGSLILIAMISLVMFMIFLMETKWNFLIILALVLIYLGVYFASSQWGDWLVESNFHVLERFGIFANPFRFPQGAGFQIINGYLAFSHGGLWGTGLGKGQIKTTLPAADTDYIMAVIAEEFGFVGAGLVLFLIMALVYFMLRQSARMNKIYHRVVIVGFALILFMQTAVNIGGLVGLLPLTGVTLPFVSYGGTSMLVSLTMIGIVQKFVAEENYQREVARLQMNSQD